MISNIVKNTVKNLNKKQQYTFAYGKIKQDLRKQLDESVDLGLYKQERIIKSKQGAQIELEDGTQVLNFCANNYLGLSSNLRVAEAAKKAIDEYGYGLSSVRFICGTQTIHKETERMISEFLGTEDTILYAACFDANGGVFEPLVGPEDAIISDELNHASIIDGVRLTKSKRYRYKNSNMQELEQCLIDAQSQRYRIIATDAVFSMDGNVAKLKEICDLADKYDALVMVDDCHGTGYLGPTGRGTHELCGVMGRIDILTTTLGKAIGGALGGATSGRAEIIEMLRQKSRPYLFSNTLAPAICGGTQEVIRMLTESTELKDKTVSNALYFKKKMIDAGFDIMPGDTAIVPVMLYDEPLAVKMANELLKEGVYVIGFCYPVVPRGKARIRTQLSAAHSTEDIDKAVEAFIKVGKNLGVI